MTTAQAMQQQQQVVNTMLQQLPQEQRSQIEQLVNTYRQSLGARGCSSETAQGAIWTFYAQCVQKLYMERSNQAEQSGQQQSQSQLHAQSQQHGQQGSYQQSQQFQQQLLQQQQQQQQSMLQPSQQQQQQSMLQQQQQGMQQDMPQQSMQQGQQSQWQQTQQQRPWQQGQQQSQASWEEWQYGQGQAQESNSGSGLLSGSLGGSSTGLLGNLGGSNLMGRQDGSGFSGANRQMNATQASSGMGTSVSSSAFAKMQGMGNAQNQMNMGSMGMARKMGMGMAMGVNNNVMSMNAMGKGEKGDVNAMGMKGMGKMGKMGKTGGPGQPIGQRPLMSIRGVTPAQRMQMQQAQQQERLMGQGWGAGGAGNAGAGNFPRPKTGTQTVIRPSSAPNVSAAAMAGTKFPPALQNWLQRLFAQQGQSDPVLQKETHAYLRYWVQLWLKSGELWARNWETFPLPSVEEIRRKLPPGSLVNSAGATASTQAPWPKAEAFSSARPFDRRPGKSRSRSRRSPFRRRRSSSTRSSRSRRRARSSRSRSGRSGSSDRYRGKGRSKGKDKGKDKKKEMEEQREKLRSWLKEKLDAGGARVRVKDLTDEMLEIHGVKPGRFRQLFSQTVQQFVTAHIGGAEAAAWSKDDDFSGRGLAQGEKDMRAQRAARFQKHLNEKTPVAMVSFDAEVGTIDGGPMIGELVGMCSRDEAKEREMTRQLDKFEWKKGTDPRQPEVDLRLACKKYQRSSADKAYKSQDVRSLDACWKTMEYLMREILDFDSNPKPGYAIQAIPYIEVYSFLRDRTRSIRVDLHLQQPRSTTQRIFVETHECCLRFEMLSLYLLLGRGQNKEATEKYDTKLGLKAISQTIEPLLNAYQAIHEKQLAKSILAEAMGGFGLDDDDQEDYGSPFEMASRRYIVLLLMSFAPDEVSSHLSKMHRELLMHPLVSFATEVYAAFHTENYARFLRMYREADFLSAVAMSGVADLARMRALWLLVRTYPQQVGDKIALGKLKNILAFASDDHAKSFLAFHGLQIVIDKEWAGGAYIVLPKKGTPEAASLPLLQGGARLPEKCEYPKGADSLLIAKFDSLGLTRAEIALGNADPIAPEVEEAEAEAEAEEAAEKEAEESEPMDAGVEPLTVVC